MFRGRPVRVVLVLVLLLRPEGLAKPRHRKKPPPAWKNPCRIPLEMWRPRFGNKGRHANGAGITVTGRNRASPKPLRRLRTQMNNTLIHFDNSMLRVDACNQVHGFDSVFDWLPHDQLLWYKTEAKCLDKTSKVMVLLPRLHEGLQVYCACFEKLRLVRQTNSDVGSCNQYERAKLFADLGNKLNQLLCEVDWTIKLLKMDPPLSMPEEAAARLLPAYGTSDTASDLMDRGVITYYGKFIKDWHRIVRNLVGKKGDKRCTNHHMLNNIVHKTGLLYSP